MAALVQSYPQQTSTITMLQARPSSASGMLQNSQGQGHHYNSNTSHMHRNSYHGISTNSGPTTYRGQTSMTPVAPYAFTSTPSLALNGNRTGGPSLRPDQRTTSAPVTPTINSGDPNRSRYPAAASVSTISSSSSSELSAGARSTGTRDDSSVSSGPSAPWTTTQVSRPKSTITTSNAQLLPPTIPSSATKSSPDRYRRPGNRKADGAGIVSTASSPTESGPSSPSIAGAAMTHSSAITVPTIPTAQNSSFQLPQFYALGPVLRGSADDMNTSRQHSGREEAGRYRRRSIHTIEMGDFSATQGDAYSHGMALRDYQQAVVGARSDQQHPLSSPIGVVRPSSSPGRSGTFEEPTNARVNQTNQTIPLAAAKRVPSATPNPAPTASSGDTAATLKHDQPQLVDIPPRGSSTDAAKRINNPSPLSKPVTMSSESPVSKDSFASAVSAALQTPAKPTYAQAASGFGGSRPESPAARQLAALNDKEAKKGKSSRLRRAFSFGSAAELRKASNEPLNGANASTSATERARLRKERYQDEQEAEQARIAQRQEEGGIGASIYSGQGNFFSGSTDNLSVSSTASSASVMLRKMGKGMKKSTRSLVGLFRPKSVIGVPAADSPLPEFSQAQVSMVTVEAEREKVNINVNPNPHDQAGGGTGFPKLDRNSLDAASASIAAPDSDSNSTTDTSRRSIVGGDRERAEVLAAVKKGILKRTGTDSPASSPIVHPIDSKTPNFNLPTIPTSNDSPISSAPSTPNDESQGHKRTGSVAFSGDDYFMSALRFSAGSKSVPGSPAAGPGTLKRNATFSPRIQFHDTWPSGEYDRRGEIATCNRLTPMLAQQIKEELNTFKMVRNFLSSSTRFTPANIT
ncbi:MAG: bud neck involved protein [Claussenomyces sp. TS43310]|nr:MAG: bud neck involved protein [Claussenomyces sp. TS43310]